MTEAVRVFYRKSDGKQVWTHQVIDFADRIPPVFPNSIQNDLDKLPDQVLTLLTDATGKIIGDVKVGGMREDYTCIEEFDEVKVKQILGSDENTVVDKKIVIGKARLE